MSFNAKTAAVWNGKEIQRDMIKELGDGFYKDAGVIADKARGAVPKRTGKLGESIRYTRSRDKSKPAAYVFAGDTQRGLEYAAAVEYGTSKMEARPFMRPAVASTRYRVQVTARKSVQKVIRKPRRTGK